MDKTTNRQTARSVFASKWLGREVRKYQVEKLLSEHESRQTISLKAIHNETGKPVVLKVFGSFSDISIREYEKEIAAHKKLKNKTRHGVLMPLETFECEGDFFIVTEYKNGEDLRKWLKKTPKITEILDVFARIAESIDYIHKNKIIHRDIKPENVVYEMSGEKITPYLTDFGISVTLSEAASSFETKHRSGTTRYMAPEFFLKKDAKMTKAVDIYAFGVMLYEALEGHHPITSDKDHEIYAQIISGVVPVPEKTIKKLGENAGFILTKALSKNPEERPKTATEIILQIESQYIKYVGCTFDKYIIEEYIGRGPFGATYKAYDLDNKNKKVALKLLFVPQAKLPEIRELKELDHGKGALPITDIGYENGVQYLVAEYLNGHNLRHFLSPEGMEMQEILKIVKPLSKTLDYLHEKKIIHRNLKPENILLRRNRSDGSLQPFVDDYGTSKVAGTTDALNANNNVLLGNFDYLAPEILENKQPSPAADVYSLGVIIYEAIEGKTPFDAKSLPALVKQKLEGNVPSPEVLLKKGGVRAARVLLKALDARPEKRQRSASDLVAQLEDAIKNQSFVDKGIFVESWVRSRKLTSSLKRNSLAFWVSGLLVLLLIYFGTFALLNYFKPASPTPPYTITTPSPVAVSPVVTTPPSPSPADTTPGPSAITPDPTPVVSCKLQDDQGQDVMAGHLLLQDVYNDKFGTEPDSYDLYAIAYYNNRKILEGYSKYHVINPVSLNAGRGWNLFIPPQQWIDKYKKFPVTIPFPIHADSQSRLEISGSSILSTLSAQISKCSAETTGTELVQVDLGNTISGLRDLCQSKVDLFGANREVDEALMTVYHCGNMGLEKFEVAKYAMVVFINKDNPYAEDIQKNPLTNEELTKLLTTAHSWKEVREYWNNSNGLIARHYPSWESGEFEIVKNGVFPDSDVDQDNVPGLNIYDNEQSLIDSVTADVNAIGIVDYDSYQSCENKNQLTAVPVNGVYVGSAIAADNDSKYPLVTTLYLYADKNAYETNETLRSFINYYLSHELDFLDDLGYLYPSKKGYTGNRDTVP
jgi:serine/threonine protein kinase/ABC-type phosphate transport system substrate-binding protein